MPRVEGRKVQMKSLKDHSRCETSEEDKTYSLKKSINRILKPLTLPSKNSAPSASNARYLESFPAESSEDVGANEDMFKSWVLEKWLTFQLTLQPKSGSIVPITIWR